MFRIDDWTKLSKWVGILSLVIFLVMLKLTNLELKLEMSLLRSIFTSVGVAVFVVYVCGKWIWKLLWHVCPKFNDWVFPNLNGYWKGTVKSNWPIVKRVLPEFAGGNETELLERPMTIYIKQDLFGIHLTLNADDDYTSSDTIVVVPEKDKKSGKITLYELYTSRTRNPKETDASFHHGAGVLIYNCNDDIKSIEGNYWTDREWRKGLNTAGSIQVIKQK